MPWILRFSHQIQNKDQRISIKVSKVLHEQIIRFELSFFEAAFLISFKHFQLP